MKKKKLLLVTTLALTVFSFNSTVSALTVTSSGELPETVKRVTGSSFVKDTTDSASAVQKAYDETNKYLLLCSDKENEQLADDLLTKEGKLDYGIAHILLNSYPTKTLLSGVVGTDSMNVANFCGTDSNEMMNIWITQQAIWGYQGTSTETKVGNALQFKQKGNDQASCDTFSLNGTTLSGNILWNSYVKELINSAKSVSDPVNTTLTINAVDSWTKNDSGYKSSLISVSTSNDISNYSTYSIEIQNAPSGIKVFSETGKDLTDSLTNIPKDTKIYIIVPEEEAKKGPKFTINASTNITYNQAYKYVDKASNHQPSVLVGPETKKIVTSLSLTIIPDTASSIANSIYFVGFLILVTGMVIIYANVKSKKEQV